MIWNKLKKIFVDSVSEVKGKGHSSTPKRQAIINRKKKKRAIKDSFKTGDSFFVLECRSKNNTKSSF